MWKGPIPALNGLYAMASWVQPSYGFVPFGYIILFVNYRSGASQVPRTWAQDHKSEGVSQEHCPREQHCVCMCVSMYELFGGFPQVAPSAGFLRKLKTFLLSFFSLLQVFLVKILQSKMLLKSLPGQITIMIKCKDSAPGAFVNTTRQYFHTYISCCAIPLQGWEGYSAIWLSLV
jgi:hypothetical protein